MSTPLEFLQDVNKHYKENIVVGRDKYQGLKFKRFSSGIFVLDLILGGGWVYGKNQKIAGFESSGKTYKAIKAMQSIATYCRCRKPLKNCDCGKKQPGHSLFVDAEGTLDIDWVKTCGVSDDSYTLVRPQYGEQTADVIEKALLDNCFDLIILDSIDALLPKKLIESSLEDGQRMAARAALVGDSFRKWNNSRMRIEGGGATLLTLNQLREKPTIYGNPLYEPGGNAQRFYNEITIWLKKGKIEDNSELGESSTALLGGNTVKNKTYPPSMEFAYNLIFKETDLYIKGEPDNLQQLFTFGKKYELIKKDKNEWDFAGKVRAKNEEEFLRLLKATGHSNLLWRSILKHVTGYENL